MQVPRARRWLSAGDPGASLELVRVVVGLVIVTHPLYDLAHPGTLGHLGRTARPELGPTLGIALAWAGVLLQIAAALTLLARRWVVPACAALIVIVGVSAAVFQWPDWYVVGGAEVTGHPGVEFSVLVIACLCALRAAHRPAGGGEQGVRGALDVVRIAAALILLSHGGEALLRFDFAGMRGWGQQMQDAGFPHGVALVWSVVAIQAACSVALLVPRWIVAACVGQIFVLANGIWSTHAPYWFVVGPGRSLGRGWSRASGSDEGGMEFSVLLIVCFVAVLLGHWRRRAGPMALASPPIPAFPPSSTG
jgi:uncharacterized membrane protein YphA (DoxX/SURF4 family)